MIFKVLKPVVISIVITLVVATVLVFTQRPKEMSGKGGLDFSNQLDAGRADAAPLQSVPMRDG
ncbi:hypothetical protein OAI26_09970, partial [Sulfitobacter sp.]|nr:hypothetical protein [Sulfitobacter sp.]